MTNTKGRRGRLMAALITVSFLMGTASPALAAESAAPVLEPKPTLAEAASAKVESLTSEAVANAAAQGAPATQNTDSEGFFKSGKGKAVLVLMIAATGFTVYSKYNDRIKSVIR